MATLEGPALSCQTDNQDIAITQSSQKSVFHPSTWFRSTVNTNPSRQRRSLRQRARLPLEFFRTKSRGQVPATSLDPVGVPHLDSNEDDQNADPAVDSVVADSGPQHNLSEPAPMSPLPQISPSKADSYLAPVRIMAVSGATDPSTDDWIQTDFLTLKAVFSSCDVAEQRWLSSFSEEETLAACGGRILIGDPTVQRVKLPLQAPPVECFPQGDLLHAFTEGLTEMARKTTDKERLLVIVCCHGQRLTGSLAIGQHAPPPQACASSSTAPEPNLITWSTSSDLANALQLTTLSDVQTSSPPSQNTSSSSIVTSLTTWFTSEDLAQALQLTNAPITVITSSCYAGNLRNPATFSLLAGSTSQELSDSLSESESGNCRGGRFVYALTDSLLAEFGMRLPTPAPSGSDLSSQRHLLVPTVPSGTLFTDDQRLHRSTFFGRKKHVDEHPIISCRQTKMTMVQQDGEGSHLPALPLPHAFPAVRFAAANPSTKYDSNDADISKTAGAVHYWKNNHYYDTKANNVALHKRIRRFDRGEATSADRKALRRTIKLRKFMNTRAQSFVKVLQDEGCTLQTCAVEIEQWVEPLGELVKESGNFWSRHVVLREWLENPLNAASISSADHYPKPALYAYVACKESGLGVDAVVEKVARVLGVHEGLAEQNMTNMSDSGVGI